ncbi:uncharacterized protein [Misgurnus anguillicaudatus]|uniref:uncharacterized protein n=1 Tax=Misgurnus anguillicaudatus TaxID=75329 RepID=UPI003CCFD495
MGHSPFFRKNNLLESNQFGFKSGHSTETALLSVIEALRQARAAFKSSELILLDLSAAFDTQLPHPLVDPQGYGCLWYSTTMIKVLPLRQMKILNKRSETDSISMTPSMTLGYLIRTVVCIQGVVLYSQCDQYILIQEDKTWHEADVFCRVEKYLLGTVHNETAWEDFRAEMSASNFNFNIWMGLYVDVNSWRWSFQNENLTFTKWASGEPNNHGGHEECGQYQTTNDGGSWNDASCFERIACVCFDGTTNRFVLVTDQTRTWSEAQLYCRQKYTDLATIRNINDQNQIKNLISQANNVKAWIGLFRDSWKWLDGNVTSSAPIMWASGQPDNSAGDEVCAYSDPEGLIHDSTCSLPFPFVCIQVILGKIKIVRLEVKSVRNISNDTRIQSIILQQFQEKLLHHGMAAGVNITWKVQSDNLLFHKKDYTQKIDTCPNCKCLYKWPK